MADIANLVIKVASTDVAKAKEALRGLGIQAKTSEREVSSAASGMATAIRGAAAAFVGLQTAVAFKNISDQMVSLESRVKQASAATADLAKVQAALANTANSNRASIADLTSLYVKLSKPLRQLGLDTNDVLNTTSAFSEALLVGGASAQEASAAILQFGQAMASGVLRGDEFNSIAEASPRVLQAIADGAGVAQGALRDMASKGMLPASLVAGALLKEMVKLEAEAAAYGATISGAGTEVVNSFSLQIAEFNKATGAQAAMANGLRSLVPVVQSVGQAVTYVVQSLSPMIPVLAGAVAGFVAFKASLAIAAVIASVTTAISAATTAYLASTLSLGGLTAAFGAARIAALAFLASLGPISIALGVVAAAGAAFLTMRKNTDEVATSSDAGAKAIARLNSQLAAVDAGPAAQKIEEQKNAVDQLVESYRAQGATEKELITIRQKLLLLDEKANAAGEKLLEQGRQKAKQDEKKAQDDAAAKKRDADRIAAAQALSSALQSISDQVAKFGMTDAESRAFDFAKLSPTSAQTAEFAKYNEQLAAMTAQREAIVALGEANKKRWADEAEAIKTADKAVSDYLEKDFGSNLAAGFDGVSAALGSFVGAFEKMTDMQDKYNEAIKAAGGDEKKIAKLRAKNATDQIGAFGDITGAAKGFFKEGSKGYKALGAAEKVFRAFELAQALQVTAAKVLGYQQTTAAAIASVGPTVAAETAKGTAAAATAVATQGTGDPYTAFPRIAAMIALMAAIGFAVGGGGSAGPGFTDNTGTGTVLGDPTAQSESIAKSIDFLGEAASLENRISSAMLASLKNIEANISGLASLIVRGDVGGDLAAGVNTGFQTNALGSFYQNGYALIDKALGGLSLGLFSAVGKLIGGLFGSKTKITGQGLTAVPQALESILANGFDLLEFVAIQTKKKAFGITTSTKNSIKTQAANPELENQFSLIFQGFADSLLLAGGPLGVATDEIANRLNGFIIDIGKINLKGLKGDEIQAKLEAVFGQQADKLATAALPMLAEFTRVGEGYFETVVRVASGIEQASTLLDRLGLSAIAYTDILNTQGDVTTEIIRQSVLLNDTSAMVAGGFAEIVGNFQGTGEEITDLVIQLRDMQDALRATGKAGDLLTTFMIAGAGGVDRLNAGLSTYFDDFLSDSERAAVLTQRVGQSFANIGQIVPQSIEGFRALIAGIDISTESGQRLYGQVIALAPAFSELQDVTEAAAEQTNSLVQSLRDLAEEARKQSAATAPVQALTTIRSQFQQQARLASLGNTDAANQLPELGRSLMQASQGYATSREQYQSDLALIAGAATRAADVQQRGMGFSVETGYTGPSIAPASGQPTETAAMQSEFAAMRADMNNALYQVAKYTQRTADRLDRWDDGDRLNVNIDNDAPIPVVAA